MILSIGKDVHKRAEKCVGAVCVKHSGSIVAGVCSLVPDSDVRRRRVLWGRNVIYLPYTLVLMD